MPPRGSDGLDFTPILTHYLFLFTSILSIVAWFIAFISQAFIEARHTSLGTQWFAIFLQLFLILGVLYTLASDAVSVHRFQISIFGAIAIVFSVQGANIGVITPSPAYKALAAGWLILSIVNIIWVLYFTSEEDSLAFHIFNAMGNGGLTPPSRRRRTRTQSSMQNIGGGNGYAGGYSGGGIGGQEVAYDTKVGSGYGGAGNGLRSQTSFVGSIEPANRSIGVTGTGGPGSINNAAGTTVGSMLGGDNGPHSPLITGIGAGGSQGANSVADPSTEPVFKGRALYAYTANADDPNEISFNKGEIMDILDKNGKWWQVRKNDGTQGIAPSNYLSLV